MLKFNKTKTMLLILSSIITAPAFSAGIPVVDAASITQMITEGTQRVKEFEQMYSQAQAELNHYKNMVEGHTAFEDILSDPNINEYIDLGDYQALYDAIGEVDDLREKYGLYSDNPVIQASYDSKLKQYKFQEDLIEITQERQSKMQSLLTQFQYADTPAKKADLANAIEFEKMMIENENNLMASMNELIKQQNELAIQKRSKEEIELMFGDGIPLQ